MNSAEETEVCRLDHRPCRKAARTQVYDNARRCKQVTRKMCKKDPTKKRTCEYATRAISRLRKHELCSYIVATPAFRPEDHIYKKEFAQGPDLRKTVSPSLEQQFFTPLAIRKGSAEWRETYIQDVESLLYLMQYTNENIVLYSEKGRASAYWRTYEEEMEQIEDEAFEGWKLSFPPEFEKFLRGAKRKNIKQVFLPLRMYKIDDDGETSRHANFLILDLQHGLMYRYEPSGYGLYEVFDMDGLDMELKSWGRKRGLEYIPPWDSCPAQVLGKVALVQRLAGKAKQEATDPGGFCKVWATFMLEQKLRHPEVDMETLQRQLIRKFRENNVDMTQFARYYTTRVNQAGRDILLAHGMDPKDDSHAYMDLHWRSLLKKAAKTPGAA